jgi:hypothetical protein
LALKAGKWLQPWLISKGSFTTIPETGLTLSALTQKVRERFGLRWGSTGVVITLFDPNKAEGIDLRRGDLIDPPGESGGCLETQAGGGQIPASQGQWKEVSDIAGGRRQRLPVFASQGEIRLGFRVASRLFQAGAY